jgi:hypothetical protein
LPRSRGKPLKAAGVKLNNVSSTKIPVEPLYEEVELEKGVLNHLRLHRNSSVHDGIKKDRIQKYLYQLKRYVEGVLSFHINNPFKVSSLSDAVLFLDLPTDSGSLTKTITQYKKVMKYRRFEI